MKSRARYSLIAAGIVAFIVLTPFLYMFVRGETYDFQNHRFIKTGSLSVVTDPKKANIFINGKEQGHSNKSIRFLAPGDYDVEIKKDGYFPWTKRLNVRDQYVTSIAQNAQQLTMFFSEPQQQGTAADILNFSAGNKKIAYATKNKVFVAESSDLDSNFSLDLPRNFNNVGILPSKDQNYFLIYTTGYYAVLDVGSKKLVDITSVFNQQQAVLNADFQASDDFLMFADNDDLYQLQNGSVFKIDWRNQKKTSLLDNVLSFYAGEQGIYYITVKNDLLGLGLERTLSYLAYNSVLPTALISNLPPFRTATMYLTDRNQLFIAGDYALYSADADSLNKIADYVQDVQLDGKNDALIYSTGNEIDIYDIASQSTNFVTRSAEQITYPHSVIDAGWVFYINDGKLQTIEIDNRDHQNNYAFTQVNDAAKFWIDDNARNLILLNDGKLTQMKIR